MSDEIGGESIERAGRRELSTGQRRQLFNTDEIEAAFKEFVEETEDFMDVPLLGAVAQGVNLIVPRTPFDDNGNPIFEIIQSAGNALGLDDSELLIDEETENLEEDPEVKIQIKYRERLAQIEQDRSSNGMYMLLLVCIIIIVFLIVVALFLYRKLTNER